MKTILLAVLAISPAFTQPFAPEPEPQASTSPIFHVQPGSGSFLGVAVQEVEAERAKALKLKEEAGVEVTRIEDNSPASKAGLKTGDVILQYNGQRVEGIEQFSRFVRETPPGRDVRLTISRDGNVQTVTAKVSSRKAYAMPAASMPRLEIPPMPDMPAVFTMWRSSMLGIEGETLKGQLADFFGVKEGVLVRSVGKDTAAAKAGLKAGDVIVKVNNSDVTSPAEISSALRAIKGKANVPVVIMRDKKELTLNAHIDNDRSEFDMPRSRVAGRSFRM